MKGKQKEEEGRAGVRLKRGEEDRGGGGQKAWPVRNRRRRRRKRKEEQVTEKEEKKERMDTGSLALSIHFMTHQIIRWWCVFTPRRCRNQTHPTPFKSLLPTISSCSRVGGELEMRQKSSCHSGKCNFRTNASFTPNSNIKRFFLNLFNFFPLSTDVTF